MRYLLPAMIWIVALLLSATATAQWIPHSLSYQGQLNDGGVPHEGNADFKFALVRTSDGVTVWSNDGTSSNGEEPDNPVFTTVVAGVFRLELGGELGMPPITPDVLDQDSELVLRMWVDVGNGFEQMGDQPIDSGFFAEMAACATGACGDFVVDGQLDVSGEIVAGSGVRLPDGNLLTGIGPGGGAAGWTVSGDDVVTSVPGNVGIGTATPSAKLHVEGDTFRLGSAKYSNGVPSGLPVISTDGVNTDLVPAHDDVGTVRVLDGNSPGALTFESKARGLIQSYADVGNGTPAGLLLQYQGGNVGIGINSEPIGNLHVWESIQFGDDPNVANNFHLVSNGANNHNAFRLWNGNNGSGILLMTVLPTGEVGIGTDDPQSKLDVRGRVTTEVLEITGGADLSEQFDVKPSGDLRPGYVVSIDAANPGGLVVSSRPYDRTVAGVISGAGGVRPGMLMGQHGSVADGSQPVALTGRVYCWVDASYGAIAPGDLLTTSRTSGHAMRVDDPDMARGAIIGKAMSPLPRGKGLVLVLVNLH